MTAGMHSICLGEGQPGHPDVPDALLTGRAWGWPSRVPGACGPPRST